MLWLVLQVFLYAIFSFHRLSAADLAGSATESSENQGITISNNVEPLNVVKVLNGCALRSAIMEKLREAFAGQFPDSRFDLRAYDIENWPSDVDLLGYKDWSRSDITQINERIPIYRFVPRETVIEAKALSLDFIELECFVTEILVQKLSEDGIIEQILERFRIESGQTNAAKINWSLLDKERIQIIDSIHFLKHSSFNESVQGKGANFSGDESFIDIETGILQSESKNAFHDGMMHLDNYFITGDDLDDSFNFRSEICDSPKIGLGFESENLDLDDFYKSLDDEFQEIINEKSSEEYLGGQADSSLALVNPDVLQFISANRLYHEIMKIFLSQHPDKEFESTTLKEYDILNWPDGVSKFPNCWRETEIEKIVKKIHELLFVKRSGKLTRPSRSKSDKIDKSDDLNGIILNNSWTKERTFDFLIKRFRKETGYSDATKIDWKLFDRRDIPAKYANYDINGYAMRAFRIFYKNPEIVNNVHFFKRPQRKRKR